MAYTFLHKLNDGILESIGVKDREEMEDLLNQGWSRTPDEAQDGNSVDVLELLKGKTPEELKENLTSDELRNIAKSLDIDGVSKDNKDTLIEKILKKVE